MPRIGLASMVLLMFGSFACGPSPGDADGGSKDGGGESGSGGSHDATGSDEASDGGAESTGSDDGFRIRDQSGAEFYWTCGKTWCWIQPVDDASPGLPPCDETFPEYEEQEPILTFSFGWRFMTITGWCEREEYGPVALGSWERAVVCDVDADCPEVPAHPEGYTDNTYECRAGFCQNRDTETYPGGIPNNVDQYLLCIGDAPRYDEPDNQAELLVALAAACPGPEGALAECMAIIDGCPDPR